MIFLLTLLLLYPFSHPQEIIELPKPKYKGEISVEEAIFKRRSIRKFKKKPLTLQEVSQLLWASGGITCNGVTGPTRSYPSAGACYPLEIYLLAGDVEKLPPGLYKYLWEEHKLKLIKKGDYRRELMKAAYGQNMISEAPISIIFTAIYSRTTFRYGERGKTRYVHIDLGHAGQNLHLQAEALKLGTVAIGAFHDESIRKILDLKAEEIPLYIMPVGEPH